MSNALLIIDIQNDYFENGANPLKESYEASLNAAKVLEHFRENHWPVFHVKHISMRPGSTFFLPDTVGSEIHKHVFPLKDEKVVIKHYPNSFRDTELLKLLQERNVTNLTVCGMMTQMCVDATVRAAKDFGFEVTLIADACATKDLTIMNKTVTAENVQNSFLAALNYFYAKVVSTNEYLS